MTENPNIMLSLSLFIIFIVALLGPFIIRKIESNLEVFFFSLGILAATSISVFSNIKNIGNNEFRPIWDMGLLTEMITFIIIYLATIFVLRLLFRYFNNMRKGRIALLIIGFNLGLFLTLSFNLDMSIAGIGAGAILGLIMGFITGFIAERVLPNIFKKFEETMDSIINKAPLKIYVFVIIVYFGFISSLITALVATVIFVEVVNYLKLDRKSEVNLVVIGCFSIAFGAVLTPIGIPLSTIVFAKLDNFWYLLFHIGKYVLLGIISLGIIGMFLVSRKETSGIQITRINETSRDFGIRMFKLSLFLMAIYLFTVGFWPLIEWYVNPLNMEIIYWTNIVSAVLNNNIFPAIEIHKSMEPLQINSIVISLLISGGMLIPGNMPNMIAANRLAITMREWAKLGAPLGMVLLIFYFIVLFVMKF